MTDQSTHQGGKLNCIEQQVREAIGDAPDVMKLALEQLLRERDPDQDAQAGQAGRIGAQFGSVSELTAIAELTPDGAARLRRLFKLVHGNFTAASKVGTVHDMRFVFWTTTRGCSSRPPTTVTGTHTSTTSPRRFPT